MRWLIIFVILTLSLYIFVLPKYRKNLTLEKEITDGFLTRIVDRVIPLEIEGVKYPHNPSIVAYKDHYLVAFRYDWPDQFTLERLQRKRSPYLAVVELDKNFKQMGPYQLLNTRADRPEVPMQAEDPRLIVHGDKIYIFYNDILEGTRYGKRQMFMAELFPSEKGFSLSPVHSLSPPSGVQMPEWFNAQYEKNWMPFVYNNTLYVIYSVSPHVVLKINPATGKIEEMYASEQDLPWKCGNNVRGGSPAIDLGDRYLTFFHSLLPTKVTSLQKKRINYFFMGSYTFEKEPPFQITAMTEGPLVHPDFYTSRNDRRVIFPSGVVADEENFYVSYGENDAYANIAVIPKKKLLEALREVKQ